MTARCPSCSREAGDGDRFCAGCGAALDISSSTPTRTSAPSTAPDAGLAPARRLTTDPGGYGRFLPGKVLSARYRIIGLLGRGGMGEVYRADDLKLGQAVALKFLPESVEKDEARLQRFLNEVKIARQISHPGVCRVYDVGEVDGHHFLSMEYVDGEDVASLLRRIGRLPKDKAVQIARQLCAGLAAAHDQGILHRDLKPANVMIDGRGRAKIADFGLAGLAEEFQGFDLGAGTPAYMAPEQRAGKGVSVRSDLYSLGLVLYELFTGQRAFTASTPAEMARLQEESTPTSPSRHVEGLDPAVERIILRCLEREPEARPPSALAVAAALPGGDPLAAALAAGETPSPEMVAAAPKEGSVRPVVAAACLGGALLGMLGAVLFSGMVFLHRRVPFDKPPEVLAERAREIARKLGHTDPPADSAFGFWAYDPFLRWLNENDRSPRRWDVLNSAWSQPLLFWYQQSPQSLVPASDGAVMVAYWDPPLEVSGMVKMQLDTRGRLTELRAMPRQIDEPAAVDRPAAPDWQTLFDVAGLDPARFTVVESRWVPFANSDARAAWEGSFPDAPGMLIRVEAAAYKGRIINFNVIGPWVHPGRQEPYRPTPGIRVLTAIWIGGVLLVLASAGLIARRNFRLGRGDRKGALRLAAFSFALSTVSSLLAASHVADALGEFQICLRCLRNAAFFTGILWLVYVSLEPYVRRWWPWRIISWSRLLAGDYRSPLVGRDILIGALLGGILNACFRLEYVLAAWLNLPPPPPSVGDFTALLGVRFFASEFLWDGLVIFSIALMCLFVLLLLQLVCRREWLAVASFWALETLLLGLAGDMALVHVVVAALISAVTIWTLARFGLLTFLSALFFSNLCTDFLLTSDPSSWYAGGTVAALLLGVAIAGYGFRISLAGQPVFGSGILRD